MSLYKRCDCVGWKCDHHWHFTFRVNRRRYRNTSETADKHKARDFEATEQMRILQGRHGIRRQPDITFKAFAEIYMRVHSRLHKRSADRDEEIIKAPHVRPSGDGGRHPSPAECDAAYAPAHGTQPDDRVRL